MFLVQSLELSGAAASALLKNNKFLLWDINCSIIYEESGYKVGSIVSLSMTLPWDLGISNQWLRKWVLHELAHQEQEKNLITSYGSFAHSLCTWVLN